MKTLTLKDKLIGGGAILIFCTLVGGGLGYLSQTGFFNVVTAMTSENRHERDRQMAIAARPVSEETYKLRTQRGWRIGCGAGFAAGVFAVIYLCVPLQSHKEKT